jgi:hypothetical protein
MIQIATSTERQTGGETTDNPHNSSLELTSAAQPARGDRDWQPWRTSAAQRHSLYSAARFPETRVWAFEDFSGFFTEPEVTLVGPTCGGEGCCYGAELAMGLLTTKDPIGFAGGLNWYVYVGNDPINRVDPRGLDDECGDLSLKCEAVCSRAFSDPAIAAHNRGGGGICAGILLCRCILPVGQICFGQDNDECLDVRPGYEYGMCPGLQDCVECHEGGHECTCPYPDNYLYEAVGTPAADLEDCELSPIELDCLGAYEPESPECEVFQDNTIEAIEEMLDGYAGVYCGPHEEPCSGCECW